MPLGKNLTILYAIAAMTLALTGAAAQGAPLRIGILPDADSLPFLAAESEDLFAAEGVPVKLIRFQNPVERDAAFQAGAVDGVIGDTLAAALAVQGGFPVKITSLTDGRYGIVASPTSGAQSLADLAGKPIGISLNSIIHYAVDTYMTQAGVPADKISVLPVPKMPVRLEMVLGGQTAAAGLPEPLLTVAQLRGARLLVSSDDNGLGAGVLMFSAQAVQERRTDIEKMYKAYWKAAQRLNANPDSYRPLLASQAGFSAEAAAAWRFVVYKKPRLPSDADMERAFAWMRSKGLLKISIVPASLLDGGPISGW
ncbi:MAG: ABC transporter substrate-binding protein [Rectinemataceae bacterium]